MSEIEGTSDPTKWTSIQQKLFFKRRDVTQHLQLSNHTGCSQLSQRHMALDIVNNFEIKIISLVD